MSSYQFQPAGIEDFDSDGDDFDFGGDDEIRTNAPPPGPPVNYSYEPSQRGGFGKPDMANGFAGSGKSASNVPPASRRGGLRNGASNRAANPATWTPKPVTGDSSQSRSDPVCVMDDLRLAINTHNIAAVQKYLDQGASPNSVFGSGWTPLMYAVQSAQIETTEILLDKGADATYQKDMYTVLMAACSSKNESEERVLQCVNKLIEKGADVNDFDRHHVTALMCAARQGRATVVKRLAECKVNLDKQDNKGWTALMWATQLGHRRVVDCLLESGASASKMAVDGRTALDLATEQSRTEIEKLLRKFCPEEEGRSRLIAVPPVENGDMASYTTAATNSPLLSRPQSHSPSPSPRSSTTTTSQPVLENKMCTKWGEIEMFLSGIDLASLVPTFQQHQIQFEDFCRLQDKDLQELGISQLGVRKKILDGIQATHKKPWQTSSLAAVQYNKKITCADAVAMLANINKHAKYVGSTVGYVSDQIQGDITILREAQSGATVEDLVVNVEESLTNVKHLFEELVLLGSHLNQVSKKNDFRPPDLLMTPKPKPRSYRRLTILLALTGLGVAVWKADSIVDTFNSLLSSQSS